MRSIEASSPVSKARQGAPGDSASQRLEALFNPPFANGAKDGAPASVFEWIGRRQFVPSKHPPLSQTRDRGHPAPDDQRVSKSRT